jgi:hypothetical protein
VRKAPNIMSAGFSPEMRPGRLKEKSFFATPERYENVIPCASGNSVE